MNLIFTPSLAFLSLQPGTQLLALCFAGWALVMYVVLHIDGTRAR